MKPFSYIVAVLALIVSMAQSVHGRGRRREGDFANTYADCVIQAFGSDLEDKGIRVEVRDPGFSCGEILVKPLIGIADFIAGEAEVALTLPTFRNRICTSGIDITVTLPYSCRTISRTILNVEFGGVPHSLGDCRALLQECGSTISPAAIPYIDMYCRRPDSEGGQTEGMRLVWRSLGHEANDTC